MPSPPCWRRSRSSTRPTSVTRMPSSWSATLRTTTWRGTPRRSFRSYSNCCDGYYSIGYGSVSYGTVGYVAKNQVKISARVADTQRATVAGVKHPAWHALRTVAQRITTPLLPDDYLKLANPLWSARELRGRVVEVRRETEDSATLVIKPGWGFTFDYQPGQYVGIGLLVDGRWRWRSYSLTSSPVKAGVGAAAKVGSSRTITITVKAMPEGFLSTHLVGGVAPGTIVRLAAPQGNFVMPDPAPASV